MVASKYTVPNGFFKVESSKWLSQVTNFSIVAASCKVLNGYLTVKILNGCLKIQNL